MTLFLISFHDTDEELGGCIMRAQSEKEALDKIAKGRFLSRVGLPTHGCVLVTAMHPGPSALVPEPFIDRLLTNEEFGEVYELLKPAALVTPEGPVLEAAGDLLTALVNADIARSKGEGR
jgi:hypothetical protein